MGVKYYQAKMTVLETNFELVQVINEYSLTEYILFSICCESRQIWSEENVCFSLIKTKIFYWELNRKGSFFFLLNFTFYNKTLHEPFHTLSFSGEHTQYLTTMLWVSFVICSSDFLWTSNWLGHLPCQKSYHFLYISLSLVPKFFSVKKVHFLACFCSNWLASTLKTAVQGYGMFWYC